MIDVVSHILFSLQAGFVLAKDLGDMEKMKPEDRNELLRTNKDVVLVHLEIEYMFEPPNRI